jgi:hypothetical protein
MGAEASIAGLNFFLIYNSCPILKRLVVSQYKAITPEIL